MKSSYLELTLKEFLDTITNKRIEYQIEIKPSMYGDDESDTITGDKYTLIDNFVEITDDLKKDENLDANTIKTLQRIDEMIKDLRAKDEYYFDELNDVEIYNYLDNITHGFDIERVKLILWDIEVYYEMDFLERIDNESMNKFIKNGWEIPYTEKRTQQINGNTFEIGRLPDYEKMRNKTHIAADWNINRAISMLKKKLKQQSDNEKSKTIDTTELLSKNLTDFLDEVRQDLKTGKYKFKLSDLSLIAGKDILEFVKRITNNF